MILFFVFPNLTAIGPFMKAANFDPEHGWNVNIQTQEIGDPIALTTASPLVFEFPKDLGEIAARFGGAFTGWRFVPHMN